MKLHNTMSGNVETFTPLVPKKISMYTCGLTVYSQPHIGNWAGYVYWDVLGRVMTHDGYEVERTQNITDVGHLVSDDDHGDDKMEKGAKAEGKTAWDIAEKYIAIANYEGYELLDLIHPTHLVRATDLIDEQIAFARELDDAGYLYEIPGEGMYFDTSKCQDYGKLARLDLAGLEAGKRVAVNGKKHVSDFAVWKFSPKDKRRDMEWPSPWGTGFPGWHLECSVIAHHTLGDRIDIHTGGIDHIPVHHTNEIAQTESLTKRPFANYWLHNNHLKIDGTKISKSLGNVIILEQIIDRGFSMDAFKMLLLSKHYRTEGNFTWDIMESAKHRLHRWRNSAALRWQTSAVSQDIASSLRGELDTVKNDALHALRDDLSTPEALVALERGFEALETAKLNTATPELINDYLSWIDAMFGLHLRETTPDIPSEARDILRRRADARNNRDYQLSDELRDDLEINFGINVKDTSDGQIWLYS